MKQLRPPTALVATPESSKFMESVWESGTKTQESNIRGSQAKTKVTVNIDQYLASHRKSPRGRGHWVFRVGDKDHWISGSYTEARRIAVKKAQETGASEVIVMP